MSVCVILYCTVCPLRSQAQGQQSCWISEKRKLEWLASGDYINLPVTVACLMSSDCHSDIVLFMNLYKVLVIHKSYTVNIKGAQ